MSFIKAFWLAACIRPLILALSLNISHCLAKDDAEHLVPPVNHETTTIPAPPSAIRAEKPPQAETSLPATSKGEAPQALSTSAAMNEEHQRLATCSIPEEDEFFGFEWARRAGFRSVCLASHWVDGLFGDNPFDPKEGKINGNVSLEVESRQHRGLEIMPRIRSSVKLPQASKKIDLFFDRDKESQSIGGASSALHSDNKAPTEEATNQLGIGYQVYQGLADLLNFRIGVRLYSWRPELFVRSRYAVTFAESKTDHWNFEQTLFWKKSEGFGETSGLEYQRHLGGPYLFRWQNGATYSETSVGVRWNSSVSIFHALSDENAIQWTYGANGETGEADPMASHGPRVMFRQRLSRRWLVLELYTGIDHVKTALDPVRQSQAYVGAKIEAHFNPP